MWITTATITHLHHVNHYHHYHSSPSCESLPPLLLISNMWIIAATITHLHHVNHYRHYYSSPSCESLPPLSLVSIMWITIISFKLETNYLTYMITALKHSSTSNFDSDSTWIWVWVSSVTFVCAHFCICFSLTMGAFFKYFKFPYVFTASFIIFNASGFADFGPCIDVINSTSV